MIPKFRAHVGKISAACFDKSRVFREHREHGGLEDYANDANDYNQYCVIHAEHTHACSSLYHRTWLPW